MKKLFLLSFFILYNMLVAAQSVNAINLKDNVAIQGYDPVAYFVSNKAVVGNKEFSSTYKGAIYYFSSEENLALFIKNPSNYLPQYGGFCAYGMSEGYQAPIEPEAFTIFENKLYLNYNLRTREAWIKDKVLRIKKADVIWLKQ
jgi:YHS domain-containing protein